MTGDGSPSRWGARVPVLCIAAAGLAISVYLAAYQLGHLSAPWDPLFGASSSERVLHSALSRALPVPDAALGALAYAVELVLELSGGTDRWRRHPWLPLLLGLVAAAMGLTGLGLMAMQAFVVHAWCTLCLGSAILSVSAALVVAGGGEPAAAARELWGRRLAHRRA